MHAEAFSGFLWRNGISEVELTGAGTRKSSTIQTINCKAGKTAVCLDSFIWWPKTLRCLWKEKIRKHEIQHAKLIFLQYDFSFPEHSAALVSKTTYMFCTPSHDYSDFSVSIFFHLVWCFQHQFSAMTKSADRCAVQIVLFSIWKWTDSNVIVNPPLTTVCMCNFNRQQIVKFSQMSLFTIS